MLLTFNNLKYTTSGDWVCITFVESTSVLSFMGTSWRSPMSVLIGPKGELNGPGAGLDTDENEFSSGASRKVNFGNSVWIVDTPL